MTRGRAGRQDGEAREAEREDVMRWCFFIFGEARLGVELGWATYHPVSRKQHGWTCQVTVNPLSPTGNNCRELSSPTADSPTTKSSKMQIRSN